MEIQLGIWTLQWSCHGANGGSGAEGQESSAPVWKINDHGATGGKDGQKQRNSETGLSATSEVRPAWTLLGRYDINYVCAPLSLVLIFENYMNIIHFNRYQNAPLQHVKSMIEWCDSYSAQAVVPLDHKKVLSGSDDSRDLYDYLSSM